LPVRDLVDAAFRLLAEWSAMSPQEMDRLNGVYAYFRDRETEFETGEIVLPSWASIGDVASRYGTDGADPFADPTDLPPSEPTE
jgi:hypothetical protein